MSMIYRNDNYFYVKLIFCIRYSLFNIRLMIHPLHQVFHKYPAISTLLLPGEVQRYELSELTVDAFFGRRLLL